MENSKKTEFITEVNSGIEGSVGAGVDIGTEKSGLPKLFGFLSGITINGEAGANANLSRKSNKIAKNILENTLLADFITLLDTDKRRKKINFAMVLKYFPN